MSKAKNNYTTLILLLILWLASWPFAAIMQMVTRFIFNGGSPGIETFVNIFGLLLGLYGLVGWIPVLIVFLIKNKK